MDRAPAAFMVGTLSAVAEVHEAAGARTIEELRRVHPMMVKDMEDATKELKDGTGSRAVEGWRTDRPMVLKGRQKEWVRKLQERRKTRLHQVAGRRQKIAMQAAEKEGGLFLSAPDIEEHMVANEQLRVSALRRLGETCHAAGRTCRNLKPNGERCGAALDGHGHHGATCECGGAVVRRHDGLRDLLLKRLATHLGASTHEEQHVREMAQSAATARLDVGVTIPGTATNFLDVAIVDSYSDNAGLEFQRQKQAGAAETMEAKKRSKYGPSTRMVPFVVEAHGRIGPSGMAWINRAYKSEPDLKRALLKEISAHVQSHTSTMIIASSS